MELKRLFPLGIKVMSVLDAAHTNFTGIVMGYEEDSLRVVCRSDKDPIDTRKRYSYSVHEVVEKKEYEPMVRFIPGDAYVVHHLGKTHIVTALMGRIGEVMLVNDKHRTIVVVPMNASKPRLMLYGITNVQKLEEM